MNPEPTHPAGTEQLANKCLFWCKFNFSLIRSLHTAYSSLSV